MQIMLGDVALCVCVSVSTFYRIIANIQICTGGRGWVDGRLGGWADGRSHTR